MTAMLEAVQWLALLGMALVITGMLHRQGLHERLLAPFAGPLVPRSGLELDSVAPEFSAVDRRTQRTVRLSDYAGRRLLIGFLSPGCGPCVQLVAPLNQFAQDHPDVPVLIIAQDGHGVDYAEELSERITVLEDHDRVVQKAYDAMQAPLIFLVNGEGRVANRTISNDLTDLEATLEGLGRPQGTATWVAADDTDGGPTSVPTAKRRIVVSGNGGINDDCPTEARGIQEPVTAPVPGVVREAERRAGGGVDGGLGDGAESVCGLLRGDALHRLPEPASDLPDRLRAGHDVFTAVTRRGWRRCATVAHRVTQTRRSRRIACASAVRVSTVRLRRANRSGSAC